jgi:tryptophanyl-tRNA synthetase
LLAGADKARQLATPFMRELRQAVGLRPLSSMAMAATKTDAKAAQPNFKQYREKDGRFYFKFVDAKGQVLLQSLGFDSPKEAGQTIAQLQALGAEGLSDLSHTLEPISSEIRAQIVENLRIL